jgi:predicted metal-binding protein
MRCGSNPNAAAAPATVSGERLVTWPLGLSREGRRAASDPRARRPAIDTSSRCRAGCPGRDLLSPSRATILSARASRAVILAPQARRRFGGPVSESPRLILCTTCRAGQIPAEGETAPGALLCAAVRGLIAARATEPLVELCEVACLANCDRGCCAAITMPGKWTYLLGRLNAGLAGDLLAYAACYAESSTGTVLPSRRPASLRDMIIGRVPDLRQHA